MRLLTYPRLNLPSKRLGIETTDWLWLGPTILPGMLFHSVTSFLVLFGAAYFYAWKIKPAKPRGWLSCLIAYHSSLRRLYADLERNIKPENYG